MTVAVAVDWGEAEDDEPTIHDDACFIIDVARLDDFSLVAELYDPVRRAAHRIGVGTPEQEAARDERLAQIRAECALPDLPAALERDDRLPVPFRRSRRVSGS